MKKLILIILILFTGNVTASSLPNCPSDQSKRYHNCFGTYIYPENTEWGGDKYVGEFKYDTRHGQGTYTHARGDTYVGEWQDNDEHGQGTYTYFNGEKYVGEWKIGKRTGKGTYTWADGDKYVGEFKDGKKHGRGTYTYADGSKYIGEYKDEAMHGQGTFTYADGTEERGYHMNDEYVPTICENMGLTKGSDPFGNCVLELIKEINKEG